MPDRAFNVLFLCTRQFGALDHRRKHPAPGGEGRFNAFSAGSHPKDQVNPMALAVLAGRSYPVEGLRSKSWDEFGAAGAPQMHFVFTVCDDAANEVCPIWPDRPMTAHWGIEDPAKVESPDFERRNGGFQFSPCCPLAASTAWHLPPRSWRSAASTAPRRRRSPDRHAWRKLLAEASPASAWS